MLEVKLKKKESERKETAKWNKLIEGKEEKSLHFLLKRSVDSPCILSKLVPLALVVCKQLQEGRVLPLASGAGGSLKGTTQTVWLTPSRTILLTKNCASKVVWDCMASVERKVKCREIWVSKASRPLVSKALVELLSLDTVGPLTSRTFAAFQVAPGKTCSSLCMLLAVVSHADTVVVRPGLWISRVVHSQCSPAHRQFSDSLSNLSCQWRLGGFFFFCGIGVWTQQDLTLGRQAFYHVSHSANPFLYWVFSK
jgi:hypothetical protein